MLGIASSVPSTVVIVGHSFISDWATVHTKAVYSQVKRNTDTKIYYYVLKKFNRISTSQAGLIVSMSGVVVLAVLDSYQWTDLFKALNLALAVIINSFRALFRASVG